MAVDVDDSIADVKGHQIGVLVESRGKGEIVMIRIWVSEKLLNIRQKQRTYFEDVERKIKKEMKIMFSKSDLNT